MNSSLIVYMYLIYPSAHMRRKPFASHPRRLALEGCRSKGLYVPVEQIDHFVMVSMVPIMLAIVIKILQSSITTLLCSLCPPLLILWSNIPSAVSGNLTKHHAPFCIEKSTWLAVQVLCLGENIYDKNIHTIYHTIIITHKVLLFLPTFCHFYSIFNKPNCCPTIATSSLRHLKYVLSDISISKHTSCQGSPF